MQGGLAEATLRGVGTPLPSQIPGAASSLLCLWACRGTVSGLAMGLSLGLPWDWLVPLCLPCNLVSLPRVAFVSLHLFLSLARFPEPLLAGWVLARLILGSL